MNGRKALGKVFGEYIDRHSLTQTDVAAMGGPSTTSQTKIRMTEEPVSPQTLRKIDTVMGWGRGTAARIIAGSTAPSDMPSITSYSNEEIGDEVRRRLLLREGGTDGTTPKAGQKMRRGDDVRDADRDVLVLDVNGRGDGTASDPTQGLVIEVGVDQHKAIPEQ